MTSISSSNSVPAVLSAHASVTASSNGTINFKYDDSTQTILDKKKKKEDKTKKNRTLALK